EAAKSTKDGSPCPDRSGLAMTNLRHFSSDMTLVNSAPFFNHTKYQPSGIALDFFIELYYC
ncbi:hypothetical protein EST62_08830, partial [Chlorobaculum sp. 24CR]